MRERTKKQEALRTVRDRIRILMRQKRISEVELASALGYGRQYVRAVITGTKKSTPARRKIEDVLGEILWGTDSTKHTTHTHETSKF